MPVLVDEPSIRVELTDDGAFLATPRTGAHISVEGVLDSIQPHLEAHAPVRYLVDARGLDELSLADRWKLSSRMKTNRRYIDRSAVFGLGAAQRFMLQVILRASGRSDVRAFERREEAERWLLAG
jgi:hypothetical protein